MGILLPLDLKGRKFGKWVVLERKGSDRLGNAWWLCQCDCGNQKLVRAGSLNFGNTTSCGCSRPNRKLIHGKSSMRSLMGDYKKRARYNKLYFELTDEQFNIITKKECFYCGTPPKNVKRRTVWGQNGDYIFNGIDRVDNTKGYSIDNCVPCCFMCNRAKNKLSVEEFFQWIERVHLKHVSALNKEYTICSRESREEIYVQ